MKRQIACLIIIPSLILPPTSALCQGVLNPGGAPAPSMRTLEQIEPRIDVNLLDGNIDNEILITEAGSYFLSRNLVVEKTYGIRIQAANVTLDLSGFEISRYKGSSGFGIIVEAAMDGASIRNGTITGFNGGIWCDTSAPGVRGCLLEDLIVSNCDADGISIGPGSTVINCRAHNNQNSGITACEGSTLRGCTAVENKDAGILVSAGSTVLGCTARGNDGAGFGAGNGCTLTDCTATENGDDGINIETNCTLTGCTASFNAGAGIEASDSATIRGCNASENQSTGIGTLDGSTVSACTANKSLGGAGISANNYGTITGCTTMENQGGYGIRTGEGATIIGCNVLKNTGEGSESYGIYTGAGSVIMHCVSRGNNTTNSPSRSDQGIGIYAEEASLVKDCSVSKNQGDGIRVTYDALVVGNKCDHNALGASEDGAGIHATSGDNRIEGNSVTDNRRGIHVELAGSLIIKNSASGNSTNYVIDANNKVGPIVIAPNSTAISGFTGGDGVGSTDPWANLSF